MRQKQGTLAKTSLDRAFLRIYREDSLREHHGKCTFCFEPLTYKTVTADHLKSRSTGGGNEKKNIGAACFDCNQTKGSMSEGSYRKAIKYPDAKNIHLLRAYMRRKINLQVDRSITNIKTYFGME